jgi:enoyl-[acyl-carrier protein] reductase II
MSSITRRSLIAAAGCGMLSAATVRLAAPTPARASTSDARGFADAYGIETPFVAAGMAFVGTPRLAAAVSNAGGMGVIGASPEPPPRLQQLIRDTRKLTSRPFAVNLINAKGFPGNLVPFTTDLHVAICATERVPVVWFHWDLPPRRWIDQLRAAGTRVWIQVGSVADARSARDLGADAVIAQGSNCGGHSKASQSLAELLPAVVDALAPCPVLAAGGIATARDVTSALAHGACAAVVGTRLVASDEAYAHDTYKARIVASDGADTVKTTIFGPEWPKVTVRVMRNRVVDQWAGREPDIPLVPPPPAVIGTTIFAGAAYAMPKFSAILPTPDTRGDFEEMALAAGDGAGRIDKILPAGEIVRQLMAPPSAP